MELKLQGQKNSWEGSTPCSSCFSTPVDGDSASPVPKLVSSYRSFRRESPSYIVRGLSPSADNNGVITTITTSCQSWFSVSPVPHTLHVPTSYETGPSGEPYF